MGKDKAIQLIDNTADGEILDIKVKVLRDASGMIVQGMVVGNTLQQNKALILMTHPGELKSRPDIGVGIDDLLLSDDYLEYRHKIRDHFNKDGLKVTTLDLYPDKPIYIDANYS